MPDESDDALIARLRAARKKPVNKTPQAPHEKDVDPWDVVLVDTGSSLLLLLAIALRVIRWIRERGSKSGGRGD